MNGKLAPLNEDLYSSVVKSISEGEKLSVRLKSFYRDVDNSQLNVFYFYCRLIAENTGSDYLNVAEALKIKFGIHRSKKRRDGSTDVDIKGNVNFISENVSDYNVREMSEFLQKIEAFMAQEKINIPNRDEVLKFNF